MELIADAARWFVANATYIAMAESGVIILSVIAGIWRWWTWSDKHDAMMSEIRSLQEAVRTMPGLPMDEQIRIAEKVGASVPWRTSYENWSREPRNGRGAAILIMRAPSTNEAMTVLDEFCVADDRIDADLAYFAMCYRSSDEAGEDGDDRIHEITQRIIDWNHDTDGLALAGSHFTDRSHPDVRYLIDLYERRKSGGALDD